MKPIENRHFAVAAVVILAVMGGVAWWYAARGQRTMDGSGEGVEETAAPAIPHPAQPTPVATNAVATNAVATNVKKRVITPEEQKKLRPGDEGFDPAAHPTILVMKPRKDPEESLPYRNSTEQALLWIMNCEPGDAPLPLLAIPQGDMARMTEILMDKCDFEEGDSEWTKGQREQLRFAKEEMRKYIRDGGDPNSFLKYYHDQLEAMHLERSMALDSVMALLREGGRDDIAEEYLKTVNKRLLDKGIKPIQLSRKKRERHGIKSNHDTTGEE